MKLSDVAFSKNNKRPVSDDSNIEDGETYCRSLKRFQVTSES